MSLTAVTVESGSWATYQDSQGREMRGTILRMTRDAVAFELYTPEAGLRVSEALNQFRIVVDERLLYSGRCILTHLVNTGPGIVCEASLEDSWMDFDCSLLEARSDQLGTELASFMQSAQKNFKVSTEFRLAVADMQVFLMELRRWCDQVELAIRSQPSGDRHKLEKQTLQKLRPGILPLLGDLFARFEQVCGTVEKHLHPAHWSYVKRQLHPLVLCAPFMYRTFQKPLGYAGDYEMVNMMIRDPFEGSSLFAKLLNAFFLETPPVVAHRNRIEYLVGHLRDETCRTDRQGRRARVLNLGCGPAKELQDFVATTSLCDKAEFTMLDFDEETLRFLETTVTSLKVRNQRTTQVRFMKKSVSHVLKEAGRPGSYLSAGTYDLVYCAGLFDYLPDYVCARLVKAFYDLLAPGGLTIVTNVDSSNPSRHWMDFCVDWHLVYRDANGLRELVPSRVPAENVVVNSDLTGVNIYLEIRKPDHA